MRENYTNTSEKQLSLGLVITVVLDVVKRWRILVATALITAMLAFVVTDITYRPVYQTTTTFVVTSANTGSTVYNNINVAVSAANLFTELLNSDVLRKIVLTQSGISSFGGNIKAAVAGDTNLLNMTVQGSDPRTVYLVSKGIVEHHHVVSANVMNKMVLEVLKEPTIPTSPVNTPDIKKTVLCAGLVAAGVATVLLAALSVLSDTVRSKEEADAKLSCHVLGELYHERKYKTLRSFIKRKKKSILITNPLTSFLYAESVNKLASRIDKRRHRGERIIMVTSFLENEGKSTVAVNLALALAKKGKKVLLIDCDLRKPACSKILGSTKQTTGIVEVLQEKAQLNECLRHLKNSGLDILPGGKNLRMTMNLLGSPAMERLLAVARENYELVILDTPPMAVAPDTECISGYADAAVLVARQNAATASDLNDAVAILNKNTHLLGCVLNNVHGSGDFAPVFKYNSYGDYGRYSHYGYSRQE